MQLGIWLPVLPVFSLALFTSRHFQRDYLLRSVCAISSLYSSQPKLTVALFPPALSPTAADTSRSLWRNRMPEQLSHNAYRHVLCGVFKGHAHVNVHSQRCSKPPVNTQHYTTSTPHYTTSTSAGAAPNRGPFKLAAKSTTPTHLPTPSVRAGWVGSVSGLKYGKGCVQAGWARLMR